jgi:signal peptidase I
MKVLSNTIYYLFVTAIVVIALLLLSTIVPIPGNFQAKIVKSGSMEPAIRTGGLVFIHPAQTYEIGDIITFGKDTKTQIPTTHRIVEVNGEGSARTFITKGDANEEADPTATKVSDVSGKVIFSVPYLGYILDFAKKPLGFMLLVGVPAIIIISDEIRKIILEVKAIKRKKQLVNGSEEYKQ